MGNATTRCRIRNIAMLLATVLLAHVSAPAVAQDSAPPPTPDKSIDARGVDVITGKYYAPWPSISIGQPGAGGLTYTLSENSVVHDSLFGALNSSGSDLVLTYMGVSSRWTQSGSSFVPADGQGGSLTFNATTNQYTYRTPQGSTVIIDQIFGQDFPAETVGRVTSVTHPTGETLSYHYDTIEECLWWTDGQCSSWLKAIRTMGVSSSLGYLIKYEYETDSFSAAWMSPTRVLAINSTVDDCVPSALQCTGLTENWPSLSFSNNDTYPAYGGTITDNLGRTYVYTETGAGVTSVKFPGSSSNDISVVYTNGRVSSLTAGGETWTYTYSDSGSIRTTTVIDSGGHMTVTKSDLNTLRVTSYENKAGAITAYQYDTQGRLKRITQPEGNYVEYQYDTRGNIEEIRRVAKPGAGLSDIVITLIYPATCSNPVTCNKPTAITDPRGKTTNFLYNATHGGVTKVELPAVDGVRPTTTYTYSSLVAYSGSVWRQTSSRACATAAICTDSVNETETTIAYTTNSRLPNLVKVRAGDESGTASITTTTYNHNDDIETIDGPLTGTGDTVYLRYDDLRRQVGMIGPDPDGGGPLKRRAKRITFNTHGLPKFSERGTVTGVSDSHWSAFASLLKETMEYDSHRRLIKTTLASSGVTHAVTQYSYDGEGRLECTAIRMNPSDFLALPDACVASTLGTFGPDRISRTSYDMADRVNKITAAYGTLVATDITQGYTANGLVGWFEDGKGNRSTYEYDGFDRAEKLRYPHPTIIGSSSTTDYEEYLYDAASNVKQQRLRDGQTVMYVYDDLGRLEFRDAPGTTNDQTFAYDLLGRILSVAISGHTDSFDYNALGQMTSAMGPLGTVGYKYDSGGRRTRVTWPDSFYVEYDYDATGAMTQVRENGATSGAGLLAVYGYDDLGRRSSLTRGNGATTTYGYDAASRLDTLIHDLPGSGSDLTVTFKYNPAGQITSRKAFNDLYSWAGQTSPATTTEVNGLNQITNHDGLSFSHDTGGNLTSDGANTYGYDADNRLTTGPGGATLDYDAADRLYEVDASTAAAVRFLYDGSNLIAEYDASGNLLRRYVHGASIDEPLVWYEGADTSDRRWLTADERGSVIAATNVSGGVATVYTYDEYGIPGEGNEGRFQYTGQKWVEAVGLYDYKTRFYAPSHGRFMQTDRIGYSGALNLYAYVAGDPVNLVDPLGMEEDEPIEEIVVTGRRNPLYRNELRPVVVGGVGGSPFAIGGVGVWAALGLGEESQGGDEEDSAAEHGCSGYGWFRQENHIYVVGRENHPLVAPGEGIGAFTDDYVPAGHPFGTNHDGYVDRAVNVRGAPDWSANYLTMVPLYLAAISYELSNSAVAGTNAVFGTRIDIPFVHTHERYVDDQGIVRPCPRGAPN